jgi:hypothetical protein
MKWAVIAMYPLFWLSDVHMSEVIATLDFDAAIYCRALFFSSIYASIISFLQTMIQNGVRYIKETKRNTTLFNALQAI